MIKPYIDELSRTEHNRWSSYKVLEGWQYGEERDDVKKTQPSLVPWDEFSPDVQEKDAMFIRKIVNILNEEGYAMVQSSR